MTLSLGRVPGHRYLCPCWDCYLWRDTERRRRVAVAEERRVAAAAARGRYKARQAERLAAGKLPHGKRSTYDAGCRCRRCRGAIALSVAGQRESRAAVGLDADDPRHGTPAGYKEWACREECCRAAHAAAELARWHRRAAAQRAAKAS